MTEQPYKVTVRWYALCSGDPPYFTTVHMLNFAAALNRVEMMKRYHRFLLELRGTIDGYPEYMISPV